MSSVPRSKTSSKAGKAVQVRGVQGDGTAEAPTPRPLPGKRARNVQQKEKFTKTTLKLPRNKESVPVPPVEFITKLWWMGKAARIYEIYPLPPMEMNKRRKGDRVFGMPLYYSLMAAEHKIILYPIPNADIEANIEYKPI